MKVIIKEQFRRYDTIFSDCIIINSTGTDIFRCKAIQNKDHEIPKGNYNLVYSWSNKFKCNLYLIEGVEGRSGIRIHSANFGDELRGCIGVGMSIEEESNAIRWSKAALKVFTQVLKNKDFNTIEIC